VRLVAVPFEKIRCVDDAVFAQRSYRVFPGDNIHGLNILFFERKKSSYQAAAAMGWVGCLHSYWHDNGLYAAISTVGI
jgi:hypothetical protein